MIVNGKPAKASVNVKVGDIIEIGFGTKTVKVRVLDLQDTTKKEEAKDLFEYVSLYEKPPIYFLIEKESGRFFYGGKEL